MFIVLSNPKLEGTVYQHVHHYHTLKAYYH